MCDALPRANLLLVGTGRPLAYQVNLKSDSIGLNRILSGFEESAPCHGALHGVYAISSHALAFSAFQHDVAVLIPASSLPVPPAPGAGRFVPHRAPDRGCARMGAPAWGREVGAPTGAPR